MKQRICVVGYSILMLIALGSPLYSSAQYKVFTNLYTADSSFHKRFAEVVISTPKSDSLLLIAQMSDADANRIFNWQKKVSLSSGFNTVLIGNDSLCHFRNNETHQFFLASGYFPPGAYSLHIELKKGSETYVKQDYASNSVFSLPVSLNKKDSVGANKKIIRTFKWSVNAKAQTKGNITYHVHIGRWKYSWELYKPVEYLRDYQWIPSLSDSAFSTEQLPVSLKKNRKYVCEVEVYLNDVLIGRSQKLPFIYSRNPKALAKFASKVPLKLMKPQMPVLPFKDSSLLHVNKPSLIQLHGSARLETMVSDVTSQYTSVPPAYARLYLSPTLQAFNIPLSTDVYLTTENNGTYKLNSFHVGVDIQKYRQLESKSLNMKFSNLPDIKNSLDFKASEKALLEKQLQDISKKEEHKLASLDSLKQLNPQSRYSRYDKFDKNAESAELADSVKKRTRKFFLWRLFSKNKSDSVQQSAQQSYKSVSDSLHHLEDTKEKAQKTIDSIDNKRKNLEKQLTALDREIEQIQKTVKHAEAIQSEKDVLLANAKSGLYSKLSFKDKLLAYVDNFDIGKTYPAYSDFTISGLGIQGAGMTVSNKFGFARVNGGTVQTFNPDLRSVPQINNILIGSELGLGKLTGTHIGVIYSSYSSNVDVRHNDVLALQGQLSLLKNIDISGEWAKSRTNDPAHENISNGGFLSNPLEGAALSFHSRYRNQLTGTVIQYQITDVPKAYFSSGIPYLRNDILQYETRLEQSFLKRKVIFSGFYRQNHDNLSGLKSSTDHLQAYGASLDIRMRKLPTLKVTLSPYEQKNLAQNENLQYGVKMLMISAVSTHVKQLKNFRLFSVGTFTRIQSNGLNSYKASTYSINEQAMFKNGWSFNAGANMNMNSISPEQSTTSVNGGATYSNRKKWQHGLTLSYGISQLNQTRGSAIYQMSYIYSRSIKVDARIGVNSLSNIEQPGERYQYLFNTVLTYLW